MCGRFELDLSHLDVGWLLDALRSLNREDIATGEVRPTDAALVIAGGVPEAMRWGFPAGNGGVVINARAETAFDKPMFRDSARQRRLAVPATGFFEWEPGGEKRRFRAQGEGAMYLAGLYQNCVTESGAREPRFAILTTAANASMAPYHDRMPVALREDELHAWATNAEYARAVLRRAPEQLSSERVSPCPAPPPEQLSLFES